MGNNPDGHVMLVVGHEPGRYAYDVGVGWETIPEVGG